MVPNTPLQLSRKFKNMKYHSVLRPKSESQNGCNKKTKHTKSSEKPTFLFPKYIYVHVRIRKYQCLFFGKFDVPCFLVTSILRFALLPYYWQLVNKRERFFFYYYNFLWKSRSLAHFNECAVIKCEKPTAFIMTSIINRKKTSNDSPTIL